MLTDYRGASYSTVRNRRGEVEYVRSVVSYGKGSLHASGDAR